MILEFKKVEEGNFIPFQGEVSLDNEALKGRTAEFLSPVSVKGTFVIVDDLLVVDAVCRVKVCFKCDVCFNDTEKIIDFPLAREFDFNYKMDSLDITNEVREEFILALPTRIVCLEDE